MSYPYPQDRHRDRKDIGEQPYKAAREAMAESEASIQAEAEAFGEAEFPRSEEEQREALQADAAARLQRVRGDQSPDRGEQT